MTVVGSSSTASISARTDSSRSSTGSEPDLQAVVAEDVGEAEEMTARNPASSIAHGACSRLEPDPKFGPASRIVAPA